jgi:AT-rich interactive domain-containing protein 1
MTQTFQSEQVLSYHQQTQSTYLPSASSIYKSSSRTSISSYVPDELDSSNSSISDNASTSNVKISHIKPLEVLKKLCEMGPEQERTIFVDRLQKLWDEHNLICRKLPSLSRQTIDLYRLYTLIREQNGFEQFSKSAKTHQWREIASKLNIPIAPTTAYHLRKKYIQLKLFHYECKYDRAGIDPEPILAEIHENNESQQQVPTLTNQVSASFPVESTYIKRRKLTSEDLHMSHSSIDSNKLLMSLRGGLLAETTWALDTLNILLTDDQTYTYFRLIEMPGLLSALVDIYIKCLRELFDEFQIKSDPILENSKQEQNHVLYRIESDCLNSYNKQKNIVYDYQENINDNPENVSLHTFSFARNNSLSLVFCFRF